MCSVCGHERCIGKYLLHPKELITINRLKEEELKVNSGRTFELVESPGNLFTKFMELHVVAGPGEDLSKPLPEVKVFIGDIMEEQEKRDKAFKEFLKSQMEELMKERDKKWTERFYHYSE